MTKGGTTTVEGIEEKRSARTVAIPDFYDYKEVYKQQTTKSKRGLKKETQRDRDRQANEEKGRERYKKESTKERERR